MIRAVSIALATQAVFFALCQSSCAAPDITTAEIATGRLYVLGKTDRPHQSVVLDGQFTTESDDASRFQYALIYHPARCIVGAVIDNRTYEAVVGNCAQGGPPAANASAATNAAGASLAAGGSETPTVPPRPLAVAVPAPAAPPTSVASQTRPPDLEEPMLGTAILPTARTQILHPPTPPQRPVTLIRTPQKAARPHPIAQRPKATTPSEPDDDGLPKD